MLNVYEFTDQGSSARAFNWDGKLDIAERRPQHYRTAERGRKVGPKRLGASVNFRLATRSGFEFDR